jgi:hypothetical protein
MKVNAAKVAPPAAKAKGSWTFKKETIFTLFLFGLFLYAFLDALTFPFGSGLYPMVIALIGVGLVGAQVVVELRQKVLMKEAMDVKVEESQKGKKAMRRALIFVGWFASLFAGSYLLGYQVVILPFIIIFMFAQHLKWYAILIIAAVVAPLILYVMPNIFQMEPPQGLLQEWLRMR